ncbi:MAG: hypothetical protein HWN68_20845 [Desulfobacterales bacterium]|nr:hypothetical protein [Desulfobacterales bacterium]
MKVKAITMPKEKAEKEWKTYSALLKTRKEDYLKELKQAYYHMKKGRKILDIYEVFKATGVNENEEPKLAIAPADAKEIIFEKRNPGGGIFYDRPWQSVRLPDKTFPEWTKNGKYDWDIKNERLSTTVPIIPAPFVPEGKLGNYFLLYEVDQWELAPPRDPILLKRISRNVFAVLACWRLTKLERAIVYGR